MSNNKSGSILRNVLIAAFVLVVIVLVFRYNNNNDTPSTPNIPSTNIPNTNIPNTNIPNTTNTNTTQPDPVRDYIIKNLPVKLVSTFPKSFVLNNSGLVAIDSTVTNVTSIEPDKFNTQLSAMAQAIISGSDCISKYSGDLSVFDACISYMGWMCDRDSAIYQVYSSTQQTNTLPNPWKVYGFDCTLVQK